MCKSPLCPCSPQAFRIPDCINDGDNGNGGDHDDGGGPGDASIDWYQDILTVPELATNVLDLSYHLPSNYSIPIGIYYTLPTTYYILPSTYDLALTTPVIYSYMFFTTYKYVLILPNFLPAAHCLLSTICYPDPYEITFQIYVPDLRASQIYVPDLRVQDNVPDLRVQDNVPDLRARFTCQIYVPGPHEEHKFSKAR